VAFCGISTGVYGFPHDQAARIALSNIRNWLQTNDNANQVDLIIFVMFLEKEKDIYGKLTPEYFPPEGVSPRRREHTPKVETPKFEQKEQQTVKHKSIETETMSSLRSGNTPALIGAAGLLILALIVGVSFLRSRK